MTGDAASPGTKSARSRAAIRASRVAPRSSFRSTTFSQSAAGRVAASRSSRLISASNRLCAAAQLDDLDLVERILELAAEQQRARRGEPGAAVAELAGAVEPGAVRVGEPRLVVAADRDQRLDQHRGVVVVADPAARQPRDRAPRVGAVEAFPRVRAREQAGVGLPVRDPLARPQERLARGGVVGQPSERVVGELDGLGDAADIEVRERDQQRGVVRRLPVRRGQLAGGGAVEDLAAAILRLGERLAGATDLAQPAHAVEVRGAEVRRRDRRAVRPAIALLAALHLRELQRVVVAGVRVRRHQRRRDALVAHAHVLERPVGGERLAPDRQVRLAVHRRFVDERQDRAAIGVAAEEAADVAVAPRDGMLGVEREDQRIERAGGVARQLGEHAQVRHLQPRRRLGQRRRHARDAGALCEHGVGVGEPPRRGAQVVEREARQLADRRHAPRRQPVCEALRQLRRQRYFRRGVPLVDRARVAAQRVVLIVARRAGGRRTGAAREQDRRRRPRRVERDLQPQHLVATRDAEQPVDRVLRLRVMRVEQPVVVGDQPLVVVAERDDRMADQVIEDDHRDEAREVRRQPLERRGHDQGGREKCRAMGIRQRHYRRGKDTAAGGATCGARRHSRYRRLAAI